jgi:NADPH:quinone reductase-like Zn-dependent oxidoreductase
MYKVVVRSFGGPEVLEIVEAADPQPGPGQVVVALTSIGMNHAELLQRAGRYKLSSGEVPFTPGLEGGGTIIAVGEGVTQRHVGQRVCLSLGAPRLATGGEGTYQSHYLTEWTNTIPAPDGVPDDLLGSLWLAYLTAFGCLIWKQDLTLSQTVFIPAASSSVGLAASQVVKKFGGIAIGATSSPQKLDRLRAMPEARFDHLVCTADEDWPRQVKAITESRGLNVVFDPVAAGEHLDHEIRLLAPRGTIWVYGLLGTPGPVNVAPLIFKQSAIRGYINNELVDQRDVCQLAYDDVLTSIATGAYKLPIARTFDLRDVQQAHEYMHRGDHIGKLVLTC